jgi:hypothetical protein
MLVLMGASALAFLARFRRQYAIVVTLYFATLTVILFTPLTWDRSYALNVGIASIRYFSVLAILPAFHLFLELADPSVARRTLAPLALMAVQVVILVLSVLVRNSAAPVVAAMAVGGLFFAWKYRGYPLATEQIFGKAASMVLIAMAFVGVLALSVSRDYLGAGRFTETIWHRIFVSLGINPEWPFGNLREVYDCPPYMVLVPGTEDRNGHCTFLAYASKHGIPINVAVTMTYGGEYDAALREAFFDIARLYPAETLETFLWHKPRYIYNSLTESLDLRPWAPQSPSPWLLAAAILNVIAFGLFVSPTRVRLVAYAVVLFGSFSTLPYLAVWAMPHTSIDLLFYCIFGGGLAVVTAIQGIGAYSRRYGLRVARGSAPAQSAQSAKQR